MPSHCHRTCDKWIISLAKESGVRTGIMFREKLLSQGLMEKERRRAYSKQALTNFEELRQPAATSDGKLPRLHQVLCKCSPKKLWLQL